MMDVRLVQDLPLTPVGHYKRLFRQLSYIKNAKVFLICEINHHQAKPIEKLACASFPEAVTHFKNDYTGRIRFFILEF